MVRGFPIAVTRVEPIHQWADIARTADGCGHDAANADHAAVCRLISSAFMGLPWPMNAAGMVVTRSGYRRPGTYFRVASVVPLLLRTMYTYPVFHVVT